MNEEQRREHAKLLAAQKRREQSIQLIKQRSQRLAAKQSQSPRRPPPDDVTDGGKNGGIEAEGKEQDGAESLQSPLHSPRGWEAADSGRCPSCGCAPRGRMGEQSDFLGLLSSLRLDNEEDVAVLQVSAEGLPSSVVF